MRSYWIFIIVVITSIFLLSAYLFYPFLNNGNNHYKEIKTSKEISNTEMSLIKDENGNVYFSGPSSNKNYWYLYPVENGKLSKEYKINIKGYTVNSHTTYGSCIHGSRAFIVVGNHFLVYDLNSEKIVKVLDLGNYQLALTYKNQIVCSNSTVVLNLFIINPTQNNTKVKLGVYNIANGEINYIMLDKDPLLIAVSPDGKYITYLESTLWKKVNGTEMAKTLIIKIDVIQNKTETYNISKYLELKEAVPVGDLKVENNGKISAIVNTLSPQNSQFNIKISMENKITVIPVDFKTTHVCLYNNSIFAFVSNAIKEYNETGKLTHIYTLPTETYFYCDMQVNNNHIYLFLLSNTEREGKMIVVSRAT